MTNHPPLAPDATIERVARAMNQEATRLRGDAHDDTWEEITEAERQLWRHCANAGLAAI